MALRRDQAGIGGVIRLAAAALLIATPASAQVAPQFAGLYRINQMEMAGGLRLEPNGLFTYVLDYGAVSEESEGRWVATTNGVLLTTHPQLPPSRCDRGFMAACFNQTPLTAEGENLILFRWDAQIVFKPVQPRPR